MPDARNKLMGVAIATLLLAGCHLATACAQSTEFPGPELRTGTPLTATGVNSDAGLTGIVQVGAADEQPGRILPRDWRICETTLVPAVSPDHRLKDQIVDVYGMIKGGHVERVGEAIVLDIRFLEGGAITRMAAPLETVERLLDVERGLGEDPRGVYLRLIPHVAQTLPRSTTASSPPIRRAGHQQAPTRLTAVDERPNTVEVVENCLKVIDLNWPASGVDFDPEFLDAEIIVEGIKPPAVCGIAIGALKPGVTSLTVYDEGSRLERIDVFVAGDARHLQHILDIRFPTAQVHVSKIQDAAVLTGTVREPEIINQIIEIAEQFYPMVLNHMRVGGVALPPSDFVRVVPDTAGDSAPAASSTDLQQILNEVRSLRAVIRELKEDVAELRSALEERDQQIGRRVTIKKPGPPPLRAAWPVPHTVQQVGNDKPRVNEAIDNTQQGQGSIELKAGSSRQITMHVGRSETVAVPQSDGRIVRVDGFDSEIIKVQALSPQMLRLIPLKAGHTGLTLETDGGTARIELEFVVQPPRPIPYPVKKSHPEDAWPITVAVGHQRLMNQESPITRIAIADSKTLEMVQFTPTKLGLIGLKPGSTSLTIWTDDESEPQIYVVRVLDPDSIKTSLRSRKEPPKGMHIQELPGTQISLTEMDIERSLKQRISLHFEVTPLRDVLEHVQEAAGVNLVLDLPSLEEEGVSEKTPVTIDVYGIRIESALSLMLEPMHLGWQIRDEALVIRSQQALKGPPVTVSYPVDGLLLWGETVEEGLERLRTIIEESVAAESWSEVGGQGVVRGHSATRSLVIRQTPDVQKEIDGLLDQLKSLRNQKATDGLIEE